MIGLIVFWLIVWGIIGIMIFDGLHNKVKKVPQFCVMLFISGPLVWIFLSIGTFFMWLVDCENPTKVDKL